MEASMVDEELKHLALGKEISENNDKANDQEQAAKV